MFKNFVTKKQNSGITYVRRIASKMSNPYARRKAVADLMGIVCAIEQFRTFNIEFSTLNSLHKIPSILEEFSITDLYCNGWRVDVITAFNSMPVRIPKIHVDCNIMADFYLIVKMADNFSDYKILGYVTQQKLIESEHDYHYYYPQTVFPTEKLVKIITTNICPYKEIQGTHTECEGLFLRFLDGELSTEYKKIFINHLLTCETCAKHFADFDKFDSIARNTIHFPSIVREYYQNLICKRETVENKMTKKVLQFIKEINLQNIKKTLKHLWQNLKDLIASFQVRSSYKQFEDIKEIEFAKTNKDAIDLIFKDNHKFNVNPPMHKIFKRREAILGIVIIVLVFALISVILGRPSSVNTTRIQDEMQQEQNLPSEYYGDYTTEDTLEGGTYYEDDYLPSNRGLSSSPETFDEDIVANRKTSGSFANVKKVSWEIPEKIAKQPYYTEFLRIAGKNIKLNLQNDLLLLEDIPTNTSLEIGINFLRDGEVMNLKMIKGSGSRSIDKVVEKSVFEAFSFIKPPKTNLRSVNITLLISL